MPNYKKKSDIIHLLLNTTPGTRIRTEGWLIKSESCPYAMLTYQGSSYAGAVHPAILKDGTATKVHLDTIVNILWQLRKPLSQGGIAFIPPV